MFMTYFYGCVIYLVGDYTYNSKHTHKSWMEENKLKDLTLPKAVVKTMYFALTIFS